MKEATIRDAMRDATPRDAMREATPRDAMKEATTRDAMKEVTPHSVHEGRFVVLTDDNFLGGGIKILIYN